MMNPRWKKLKMGIGWLVTYMNNPMISYDPVRTDPQNVNNIYPASLRPLVIDSHGANLNGMIYLAAGKGPHPTVILLHGFPGYEHNLDIAQASRRAGWNVVYFNYRGSWGSEGFYAQQHLVEDTLAVFEFLCSRANEYHINPQKIALIGHSMGGATALAAAIEEPAIRYVASLAGVNWGAWATLKENDSMAFATLAAQLDGDTSPLVGFDGKSFLSEINQNHLRYDVQPNAKSLVDRQILLIGGKLDLIIPLHEHHFPLLGALEAENASGITTHILEDDHVFSNTRIALTELILEWLASLN
jgi:dipeptidyl aminopeptidase/acylaminoacyl peptidase